MKRKQFVMILIAAFFVITAIPAGVLNYGAGQITTLVPSEASTVTVNPSGWYDYYTTLSSQVPVYWSFSTALPAENLNVMAMTSANYAIFAAQSGSYTYYPLSSSSSGSGTFYTQSSDTWYFVFYNQQAIATTLTSSVSTTAPATVPGAPQSLTVTYSSGSIDLTWNAPYSDGGASISSYNVYRSTYSGGETLLATVYSTSYSDSSIVAGDTYYYTATAVNSVGEGAHSSESSVYASSTSTTPTVTIPPYTPFDYTPIIIVTAIILLFCVLPIAIASSRKKKAKIIVQPVVQPQQQQQQQQTVVVVQQATPVVIPTPTVTQAASTETKFCSTCGATIKNKSKFCDSCGAVQ